MKKKLLNFWYYYKIYIIIGLIVLTIILVGINSCVNRAQYDVNLLYITHGYSDTFFQTTELVNLFDGYADDVNNDGKKNVQLITINYGRTAAEYNSAGAARAANLAGGKNLVFLVDKQNYDELKKGGFLEDLSSFGDSEYINGDCFEIYKSGLLDSISGFKEIGDEYYLCIRKYDAKKAEKDKTYKNQHESAVAFMKNIIADC